MHDEIAGPSEVDERLLPVVYSELRRIARQQRGRGLRSATLNTTALVHEAYLSLSKNPETKFADSSHFLATAAVAMRRLLMHQARHHSAEKRGSGKRPLSLEERDVAVQEQSAFLLDLERALEELGAFSPRLLQVVECRFFGGFTEEETAQVLDVTARTVRRDWVKARSWLEMELSGAD